MIPVNLSIVMTLAYLGLVWLFLSPVGLYCSITSKVHELGLRLTFQMTYTYYLRGIFYIT